MKSDRFKAWKRSASICALVAGAGGFSDMGTAYAADVYWDTNSTTSGFGSSTTGPWSTNNGAGNRRWGNSAGTANPAAWIDNNTAIFASTSTAATITIDAGNQPTVRRIVFDVGGYVIQTGTLTLTTSGSGGTAGSVAVNAGTATINSAIAGNAGLTKDGSGTLVLGGSNSFSGGVTINSGIVRLATSNALNSSSPNSVTFGSSVSAGTTLQLNGNSVTVSSLSSNATPGSPVVESGSGTAGTDTLTVNNSSSNSYAGVLQNGSTRLLALTKTGSGELILSGSNTYSGGTAINGGSLQLGSSGAIGSAGTIGFGGGALKYTASNTTDYSARFSTAASQQFIINTNGQDVSFATALTSSGGSLSKTGLGQLTLSGSVANTVAASVDQGTLLLNKTGVDAVANSLTISGTGTAKLNASNQISDSASVAISAGTLDLNGNSDAIATLSNGGTLQNGSLTVTGNVTSNTGATYSSINLTMAPAAATTTQVLGSASTISGVGTFAINGASNGAVNLNGKSLSVGTFTLNNGTVSSGTITAGTAINVEAGTVSATLDGAAGLTKSTAGTVTLSGTQAYTGNTVVTAGTLRLGNSDAIDNASKLVLNGGTFATQGNGDTLNTLQLTENSTIDMGSGSSQLDFAESFAEAWTAGKTLNITNYTNNLLGTGVDRIYVGTAPNGLTWAQLQQIKFVNPDGFAPGTYGATILSDGQVVIPEPASLGLIALGGTALLMRRRRKA